MMINPLEVIRVLTGRQKRAMKRAAREAPARAAAFAKAKRVAGGKPKNCGSRQQDRRRQFELGFQSREELDLPRRIRRRIARRRASRA